MHYTPNVDDYVKWNKGNANASFSVEGWVYFKDNAYLTIEIGVKCKDDEDIEHCPIHKKTHTLVVCYPESWKDLTYVKSRQDKYDEK